MTAEGLYQAGKLEEAVRALSAEVRDNPTNARRRTFLFELLCFAGQYDRAEKQLDALAQGSNDTELGALVYRSALYAERIRQDTFQKKEFPEPNDSPGDGSPPGMLNGKPFQFLSDADPRIGARLEVFAGGNYLWMPFQHLASIEMQPPRRLRDLLWIPALLRTGPGFKSTDLGEVLLPVLSPFAWQHADDSVRLGRETRWEDNENGDPLPVGQKMLLVDDEEFPFLELRKLEFAAQQAVT
jgi:type VI secretion system protein ImpE